VQKPEIRMIPARRERIKSERRKDRMTKRAPLRGEVSGFDHLEFEFDSFPARRDHSSFVLPARPARAGAGL